MVGVVALQAVLVVVMVSDVVVIVTLGVDYRWCRVLVLASGGRGSRQKWYGGGNSVEGGIDRIPSACRVHVRVCVFVCVCVCVCAGLCLRACMHACVDVCVRACMHACVRAF